MNKTSGEDEQKKQAAKMNKTNKCRSGEDDQSKQSVKMNKTSGAAEQRLT